MSARRGLRQMAVPAALLMATMGGAFAVAGDARAEEPSVLPGQPGGDPAPDTKEATDLVKRGRFEDAIVASRRALQRDERYVPAMLIMAKAYYGLKKMELATSIVDLARQLDANNAEAYNILGFIALSRNDISGAAANFKKAVELKGDYGNAWNTLCAQLLLAKSYDPAVDACEHATKELPNFDKAWLNMGSAYRGKGQLADAEKAYQHAIQINPNYADAYFDLGILYLDAPQMPDLDLQGKETKAIDFFSKYKNLASSRLPSNDPTDSYVEEARKTIDREQKRLEREAKKKARDAAKKAKEAQQPAAPAATPDAPPAAPAPTGTP